MRKVVSCDGTTIALRNITVTTAHTLLAGATAQAATVAAIHQHGATVPLPDAIASHPFTAVLGGGHRDEEKARTKKLVFSVRDAFKSGVRYPHRRRPELDPTDDTALIGMAGEASTADHRDGDAREGGRL